MFVFKAAVVGAGATGGEIAQAIAAAGIPVLLKDADETLVDAGLAQAREVSEKAAAKLVAKGKLSEEAAAAQVERIVGLITADDHLRRLRRRRLRDRGGAGAAASSSTASSPSSTRPRPATRSSPPAPSELSITEIGEITLRPDQVVGFHPRRAARWSRSSRATTPRPRPRRPPRTSRRRCARRRALRRVSRLRRRPRPRLGRGRDRRARRRGSRDAYGDRFQPVATSAGRRARRLKAFVEACLVLEEGVAGVRDIDMGLMLGAGMVPGPFARADQRGLDEVLAALEAAEDAWGEHFEPPLILRRLVAQGRLGAKSRAGLLPVPAGRGGLRGRAGEARPARRGRDRLARQPARQLALARRDRGARARLGGRRRRAARGR